MERLPVWVQKILFLRPLTHAADAIRTVALEKTAPWQAFVLLTLTGIVLFLFALRSVNHARN